jgi:hypothetical protein
MKTLVKENVVNVPLRRKFESETQQTLSKSVLIG